MANMPHKYQGARGFRGGREGGREGCNTHKRSGTAMRHPLVITKRVPITVSGSRRLDRLGFLPCLVTTAVLRGTKERHAKPVRLELGSTKEFEENC